MISSRTSAGPRRRRDRRAVTGAALRVDRPAAVPRLPPPLGGAASLRVRRSFEGERRELDGAPAPRSSRAGRRASPESGFANGPKPSVGASRREAAPRAVRSPVRGASRPPRPRSGAPRRDGAPRRGSGASRRALVEPPRAGSSRSTRRLRGGPDAPARDPPDPDAPPRVPRPSRAEPAESPRVDAPRRSARLTPAEPARSARAGEAPRAPRSEPAESRRAGEPRRSARPAPAEPARSPRAEEAPRPPRSEPGESPRADERPAPVAPRRVAEPPRLPADDRPRVVPASSRRARSAEPPVARPRLAPLSERGVRSSRPRGVRGLATASSSGGVAGAYLPRRARQGARKRRWRPPKWAPSSEIPATTYSPRESPPKYHRRWRSSLPCSEWERVFPRRYRHRKPMKPMKNLGAS
jgi:hypothetical protein